MKLAVLASLAATALAQNVFVSLPGGNKLTPGEDIIVQVTRPNSLTGSTDLAVAIGLQSCPSNPCLEPSSTLGTLLYNGSYTPQYHEWNKQPYENFTVTVPETTPKGNGQIGVAHFALVGASNWPLLQTPSANVTIV
ncbi:hypothetical protein BDV18DRAFT_135397 [Aspergillus unguis]